MKSGPLFLFCALMLLIVLPLSCGQNDGGNAGYSAQIQEWRQKRLERLTSSDSWLSLAGLYWLKPGDNTFGSDPANDVIFPATKAPARMGRFILSGEQVVVRVAPDADIRHDGQPVKQMLIYADSLANPPVLSHGSLSWFVIKRADRYGIRLKDAENPAIAAFPGIMHYEIDPAWRAEAVLEAFDPPRKLQVANVTGMDTEELSPGELVFTLRGKACRLVTLDSGDDLFVIFADETSGETTYGAGRYLYVKKPAPGEKTVIDFNKAYSPPCAFTPYATCPLPPPQNHLPLAVTAGEKYNSDSYH